MVEPFGRHRDDDAVLDFPVSLSPLIGDEELIDGHQGLSGVGHAANLTSHAALCYPAARIALE